MCNTYICEITERESYVFILTMIAFWSLYTSKVPVMQLKVLF